MGAPGAELSATSLIFASTAVGSSAPAQTVTLTNNGSSGLVFTSFKVAGANAADFKATSTTCTGTIAVAAKCTIAVVFTPAAAGARSATLTLTDNAGNVTGATQTVNLSGTGAGVPKVTISPASFAFGSETVGGVAAPVTVSLSNPGTGTLTISSIAVTGADAGDFLEFDTCTPSVAIGAKCEIALYFLPKAVGARTATVVVTDNANSTTNATVTQNIPVTGTGTGSPMATLSATSMTFATTRVGALSAGQSITITNSGNAPLTFTGVAVSGTNAADFMQFNTCTTVAAGDTCILVGFFEPTATGARTASVTLTDNSGGTTGTKQTVTLKGTGD
jgi:hypothetical protein